MYLENLPPYLLYGTRKTENEVLEEYRNYLVKIYRIIIPKIIKKSISTMDI